MLKRLMNSIVRRFFFYVLQTGLEVSLSNISFSGIVLFLRAANKVGI